MIEKMKKVTVLSEGSRRKELLSRLREAGVMHISDIVQKAPSAAPLEEERAEYQRILQVLSERRDKKNRSRTLVTGAAFDGVHTGIKEAVDSEAALKDRIIALQNERERIIPFGDFDPDDVRKLAEDGVRLSFYTIGKKELGMLREDESVSFIPVACSGKSNAVALVDAAMPDGIQAQPFRLPEKGLSELDAELASARAALAEAGTKITAAAAFMPGVSEKTSTSKPKKKAHNINSLREASDSKRSNK